jgi:hypothetical protein
VVTTSIAGYNDANKNNAVTAKTLLDTGTRSTGEAPIALSLLDRRAAAELKKVGPFKR